MSTLETPRLLLRPPTAADLPARAVYDQDAEVKRWIGGVLGAGGSWRSAATAAGHWHLHGYGMFSVIEKATGRWIGQVGPQQPAGWPGTEVGWALVRDAQGRGYALEAATAAMDFAVDQLGWTEIIHCIVPENVASIRLARRLGSSILRQATMPDPIDKETTVWGQTADAWRARRANP